MLLKIHARPNAPDWHVVKRSEDEWVVFVPYPPQNDEVNRALIRFLRRYFNSVRLLRGRRSRLKVFEVE